MKWLLKELKKRCQATQNDWILCIVGHTVDTTLGRVRKKKHWREFTNPNHKIALPEEDDIIQLPDLGPNDMQPMVKRRKIDDSTASHEYHPTAGKIFQIDKMAQSASTKYISPMSNDFYSPFVSEEDWKFAEWLIEEDIGKAAGDRLMSITKV